MEDRARTSDVHASPRHESAAGPAKEPALRDGLSVLAIIAVAVVMLPVYLLMVAGSYRASRYHYGS